MQSPFPSDQIQVFDFNSECQVYYHPKWLAFKQAMKYYQILKEKILFQQFKVVMPAGIFNQARLTAWFGDAGYTYSGLTIQPEPWIPELVELRDRLNKELGKNFNSVLANYYHDGSNHVGWHADDETKIGDTIASVSLGGLREFNIRSKELNKHYSIELQAGSLLVMAGETQKYCQHCIVKTRKDVEPRINLTFRIFR